MIDGPEPSDMRRDLWPRPTIRVGVIGAGERSTIARYVPEGSSGVDARVVAVADVTETGRVRARADFPFAEVVGSHTELAASGAIDAAIVTTPDATHARIAIDLLNSGIAVYLEKPLATTVDDADAVLAAAAATGTPLYVGHNFRHSGVVNALRNVVESGEVGEVKTVWCRHFVGHGGDYYFKDWHADRRNVNSLLLQKASHDLDVIHLLAGGYTRRVVGMGSLSVYGSIDDRRDRSDERLGEWFSLDNWPPLTQTGLHPVVDVEDVSMMLMSLDNGVVASYEQCHFTPDYWRNYTIVGTEGRAENFGDTGGGVIKVWNHRRDWQVAGDREYPIAGVPSGHADADEITVREFLRHLAYGEPISVSPVAAREAVAVGDLATRSLRDGSTPREVPPLSEHVLHHFSRVAAAPTPISTP
ncbi:Gfo/Idh/MocA family protein [Leifsonia sp. McL0607]|uniref:Gfo/Idh/MocA family protein n=1 Tax=Leifsonia sp. McL0607 TaxID=3415672 RepID=UPI003CF5D2B2